MPDDFAAQRQKLIETLRQSGIQDARVLAAIERVPREVFVDESLQNIAYANQALPLYLGQTISQPLIVALMTQALQLRGTERVLEIGTGSGYQTAILAHLVTYIYSVERHQQLSQQSAARLARLGLQNISYRIGDGSLGWPDAAPFDRILVTAAAPQVPPQLIAQLTIEGLLVIPVGSHKQQELQVIRRIPQGTHIQSLGSCVFVPLVGQEGWHES
ncbi:MAG: protein-L-isoaspartate(D-aspartate) O-methyltransferase [Ktedonobacteraceae bacterium]